jgi:hypothetical protein
MHYYDLIAQVVKWQASLKPFQVLAADQNKARPKRYLRTQRQGELMWLETLNILDVRETGRLGVMVEGWE